MSFKDKVGVKEQIDAVLDSKTTPPTTPCPKCSSEMKEHHPTKHGKVIVARSKICSKSACRQVVKVDVDTGQPIVIH